MKILRAGEVAYSEPKSGKEVNMVEELPANTIAAFEKRGYLKKQQLLEQLVVSASQSTKMKRISALLPPPAVIVKNVPLWSPDQLDELIMLHSPHMRFSRLARRFIVGEFLPDNQKKVRHG